MTTSRAQQAFAYFQSRGYSPLQAATIVGNLQQESGMNLDTTRYGDRGTAFGMGQWRQERQNALRSFAAQQGRDPSDFPTQLAFVDRELRGSESRYGNALRAAQNPTAAAQAMISYFRPAGWTANNPAAGHGYGNRVANAAAILGRSGDRQQLMAQSLAAGRTPSVDSNTNRAVGGTEAPQAAPAAPQATPTPPEPQRMNTAQWEQSVNNMQPFSTNPALDFQLRQQVIGQGYMPGRSDLRSPNEPPANAGLFGLGSLGAGSPQQPNAGWGWPPIPVNSTPLPWG